MTELAAGVMGAGTGAGVLLEREAEMSAARVALARAQRGQGSGLVIDGPAGIGKSRLLGEIIGLASATGMTMLSARSGRLEHDYPFGVVRQLLGAIAADPERGPRAFGGAGRTARRLFDVEPEWTAPHDVSFAVLDGLYGAFANITTAGAVLVSVDDAQWADGPSLRLLDFLSRRLDELPLVLVIARHPGSGAAPGDVLAELQAGRLLSTLTPAPLSLDGVADLVRLTFDVESDPDFAAACHRRTGGNPFFLVELLRECAAVGVVPGAVDGPARVAAMTPRAVGAVVKARLSRLGSAETKLAQAIAFLGDGVELIDAAALAGMSAGQAADSAGALAEAGFVSHTERLEIVHPLLAEVLLSDLPAVRTQQHAAAARLLHARGRDPEAIAAHVALSPRAADDWNVERLRDAARLALTTGAPEVAVRLLRRALAEPPSADTRGGVLVELGTAHAELNTEEALAPLTEGLSALAPGTERAAVGLLLARLLSRAGRSDEAGAVVIDARAMLGVDDRELALALDAIELSVTSIDPDGAARRRSLLSPSGPGGPTAGERAVRAGAALQMIRALEPVDQVLELVQAGDGDGGWSGEMLEPFTASTLTTVLSWGGRISQSVELSTALIEQASANGSTALWAEASALRAHARWRGGDLVGAESDACAALAVIGQPAGQARALATQTVIGVLTDRGELDAARVHAESLPDAAVAGGGPLLAGVECARAGLDLALGNHEAALGRAVRAGQMLEMAGCVHPAAGEWRHLAALAHLALGRCDEARAILAPALNAARRSGGAYELGLSLRVAARLEQPVDLDLLAQARARLEGSEFRLLHAAVLMDMGATLRRVGRRREARQPLAEGIDLAHVCGAHRWVAQAHVELLAAGARPRRIQRSGVQSLTPSELRVAALAADGLSNREIAQQLYVSIRTVESQLRTAYRKLGIASRDELTDAVADTAQRTHVGVVR